MKIKICGIKTENEALIVNEAQPDFIGFIFANTKRFISYDKAFELRKMIDPKIQAVGVFVDTPILDIIKFQKKGVFEIAQLHGEYSENDIIALKKEGIKTIKVIRVQREAYNETTASDYLLFDTYVKGVMGGTNKQFNQDTSIKANVPFFVAGGINASNVKAIIEKFRPYGVDISSGVEIDGFKTKEKVQGIIKTIKDMNL